MQEGIFGGSGIGTVQWLGKNSGVAQFVSGRFVSIIGCSFTKN
jgi:hypothetical protein